MRSSLIVGVTLLLAIAAPSIVQARKSEGTCGDLGPGINACKCGEIVVKAAKVQKPLFYASPEAINEAAVAREAVGRLSIGSGQSESVPSFSNYKPYASGTFSSSSSSGGSSFSSSSSSSSVGVLSGRISGLGGSKAYSRFNPISGKVTSSCGCGKTSESLQIRDLLSSNAEGKVVPSFRPIGDLCYPSPAGSPRSDKFQVTTKVTPAYPGKIKCAPPSIPYEVCVQILNGQIDEAGLRKLGLTTGGKLGEYISNGISGAATQGGEFYGSLGGYSKYAGSSASSIAGSSAYGGYGSYAGAGASSIAGSSAYGGYGSYAGAGASANSIAGIGIGQSSSGTSVATSSNVETVGGSAASYRSNYDDNFGDNSANSEFSEDYSYPRLPADPVSVTLAYKNLLPHTLHYNNNNNRRVFVPEDKLAFGHRTVPTQSSPGKKVADIPEEKLQTLDKPVVELKPVPPVPVTVGVYDEHEEAKLAELEAIERERINQEEIAQRQQENFITYGDLGYAPCNQAPTGRRPFAAGPTGVVNAEDIEADCGPVGPPDPDYVPGQVVIDREPVENEDEAEVDVPRNSQGSEVYVRHYDETSDEEDDIDDSTSGIFARLRSVAKKYGPSCGAPL